MKTELERVIAERDELRRQVEAQSAARERDRQQLAWLKGQLADATKAAAQASAPAPAPDQSAWLRQQLRRALALLRVGDAPRASDVIEKALELPPAMLPETWEQRTNRQEGR